MARTTRTDKPHTAKTTQVTKPAQRRKRAALAYLTPLRIVSLWAGGAGMLVLGLSVGHGAKAIQRITGDGAISVLLAVGIDLGMVACEVAEVLGEGAVDLVRWARRVVLGTVVLSAALNGLEFSARSEGWAGWLFSWGLGILVPFLVFGLFRVAAKAWEAGSAR